MKTSVKLVLLYFAFQIAGAMFAMVFSFLYSFYKTGTFDTDYVQSISLAPAMLLGFLFMSIYLWKAGYIDTNKLTWSPVSIPYLLYTVIIYSAAIFIIDFILSLLPGLPNLLEDTFNVLQSGWLGILSIAILGPILEELLFRGAITKSLLNKFSPTQAIVISAIIFGVVHINPVQVVSAFLIGLLLAWLYYKTASLIPCILVHILNNSLSVYLNLNYPEVETTKDFFVNNNTYLFCVLASIAIFAGMFFIMKQITVPYTWKTDEINNKIENIEL